VNKPKFKVEHVEKALRASGGVVSDAAQKLAEAYGSCSPASVRNYIRRHKSLQEVLDEVIEDNLDIGESALINGMKEGNMTAVIFYLKTKGKARGYVERTAHAGPMTKAHSKPPPVVVLLPDNRRTVECPNAIAADSADPGITRL
jgi:hypothetical protein